MKRIVTILLFLSVLGAVVAAVLTVAHFNPDLGRSIPLCGGAVGSCAEVSELPYAVFLGIPVAAYGLFFYLVVLFTLLIADAAGGRYYRESAVLLLPLCALALFIDAGLGVTLIVIRKFCLYCVATYAINVILFVLLFVLFRTARKADGVSYRATLRGIFRTRPDEPDRRAIYALYVVCLGLLFFSVFSLSYALGIKTRAVKEDIGSYVEDFYKTPPAAIEFPESTLVVGNPDAPLTIYVFTDFLCSACYRLYQNEEVLLKQFSGKIRFVHFNFPLDATCNGSVRRTVYTNSCIASRSMLAASVMGVFPEYFTRHFGRYTEYKHNFSPNDIVINGAGLFDPGSFEKRIESPEVTRILMRDIALAERLGIKGTPTLFINGREIGGVLPREAMEMIVTRELSALESGKK